MDKIVLNNIDYLADGFYDYTIVAYDIYVNYARDTVLITVANLEKTSFGCVFGNVSDTTLSSEEEKRQMCEVI